MEEATIYAGCDCGERYPVSIGGADLETMTFTCPKCGMVDRFSTPQVLGLKEHFGDAVGELSEALQAAAKESASKPSA